MRILSAAALALTGILGAGCGLILGSGDYAVGGKCTEGTGGAGGASSASIASSGSGGASVSSGASDASAGVSATGAGGAGGAIGIGVLVSPKTVALLGQTTLTFTATVGGAPSSNVVWSAIEPGAGSRAALSRASSARRAGCPR